MNKKGQSLILFIIFLPIMLILFAFIVDIGLLYNAKIKGEGLLKTATKEGRDLVDYFKINDIDITNLETSRNEKGTCVIIKYRIESVFGNIIGYENYEIEINNCEE